MILKVNPAEIYEDLKVVKAKMDEFLPGTWEAHYLQRWAEALEFLEDAYGAQEEW